MSRPGRHSTATHNDYTPSPSVEPDSQSSVGRFTFIGHCLVSLQNQTHAQRATYLAKRVPSFVATDTQLLPGETP